MDAIKAKDFSAQLQGKKIGQWTVTSLIDHGKSAIVLNAHRDGKEIALKVMDPALVAIGGKEKQLKRLAQQEIYKTISHPNLITIYEAGQCDNTGHLYVAMEKLPGKSLAQMLPTLTDDDILPIISAVARAAKCLEDNDLVHRDIKPDNVVIDEAMTRITLADMGVLRQIWEGDGNGTGIDFVGTHRYSPPEFILGKEEKTKDGWRAVTFYQLGALLYDLIMRRRLFEEFETSVGKLIWAIFSADPLLSSASADSHLVRVARQCLAKDPIRRTSSVTWDDFFEIPKFTERAEGLKEKLRRVVRDSVAEPPTREEEVRNTSIDVKLCIELVDSTIRDICAMSAYFSPITLTNSRTAESIDFLLIQSSTSAVPLRDKLNIIVRVRLDTNLGDVVQVVGCARLAFSPAVNDAAALYPIFHGQLIGADLRAPLDEFLHRALLAGANASELGNNLIL